VSDWMRTSDWLRVKCLVFLICLLVRKNGFALRRLIGLFLFLLSLKVLVGFFFLSLYDLILFSH
jgi:hypothetical protein